MTNSELISLSTVHLECHLNDRTVANGTGFYFSFTRSKTTANDIVIITNKHVVEDSSRLKIKLFPEKDQKPDYENHFDYYLDVKESDWIFHPDVDVDLCMIPLENYLDEIEKDHGPIFFYPLDKSQIPNTSDIDDFRTIEDVLMIGYPLGLHDYENNVPFIRQGITSMHPKFDYDGLSEFVIDAAILPGSSGSPVVILNEGGYTTKEGHLNMKGRFFILGVLYAEPAYELEGIKEKRKIARKKTEIIVKEIPTNLGIVIKSSRILEMEDLIKKTPNNVYTA